MATKNPRIAAISTIVLFFLAAAMCPCIGMQFINPFSTNLTDLEFHIFAMVRLPRTIAAFAAGGGLALCGLILQAIFRNPLAEPFTLGISSGASCGAAMTILLGVPALIPGIPSVTIGALLGAFAAVGLVYGFSRIQRYFDSNSMLLSGIVVSFLFSSLMMLVQYLSNLRDSFYIVRWLMGGLEIYGYTQIFILISMIALGTIIIFFKLVEVDQLLTGDDVAHSRGVNVGKTRLILLFAVTIIAGGIVSICGPIGFVGLMVPYAIRHVFGLNHRVIGPIVFICGGCFLVLGDTIARTFIAPVEIPVGVITSLLGAPFFLWLLIFKKGNLNRGFF